MDESFDSLKDIVIQTASTKYIVGYKRWHFISWMEENYDQMGLGNLDIYYYLFKNPRNVFELKDLETNARESFLEHVSSFSGCET